MNQNDGSYLKDEFYELLQKDPALFEFLQNGSLDGVWYLDLESPHNEWMSPRFWQLLGYDPTEKKHLASEWQNLIDSDDLKTALENLEAHCSNPEYPYDQIVRYRHKNGSIVWVRCRGIAIRDVDGKPVRMLGAHNDITEIKKAQEELQAFAAKLRHDAFHDPLTGLPNRALLMERLKQALHRQQRHPDGQVSLLFLDLDRFKIINDSFGHLIGDELLIALGSRLEKCQRASDTLARLGGDEFVILLEELKSRDEAINVAERLHQALKKPFVVNNQELFVSASIGIAMSSSDYDNEPEQLLRDADTALYRAKARGKSCYAVFDVSMHTNTLRQLRLENDLRRAVEREELVVYYQPIVSLENESLEGIEALVRWQHPEQGLVSPADFIPMAEESGIIIALDQWVLKNACRQLCYWKKQFPACSHLTLNVNLSGQQFFQSDLIPKIEKILTETGILGQDLRLEITESVLIENSESVLEIFNQLRDQKIQVCLDDFGTGYSSLSYLNRFPFNVLKIDPSFINNLGREGSKSAIVRAIVIMARELEIEVIAEGVERAEQIDFLKTLGGFGAQGYWFSPPLDTQEMTHLLKSSSVNRLSKDLNNLSDKDINELNIIPTQKASKTVNSLENKLINDLADSNRELIEKLVNKWELKAAQISSSSPRWYFARKMLAELQEVLAEGNR